MKKQNLQKELYPILENESIKIGTFKANRSIDTLDFIKENIKFWKSYDGHKLPDKQVIFERVMRVIRVIRVLRRILTDSDIIICTVCIVSFTKIYNNLDSILRNLLVAGNAEIM